MWEKLNHSIHHIEKAVVIDKKAQWVSHQLCLDAGLYPDMKHLQAGLEGLALKRFLQRYAPVITAAKKWFPPIYQALPDPFCIFILTDPAARVIHLFSSSELMSRCAEKGVLPGTSLSEESCGTNAVALSLQNRKATIVKGRQHFLHLFHDWHCIAAPIFDAGKTLVGCIDFSTASQSKIEKKLPLITLLADQFSPVFPYRQRTGRTKNPNLPISEAPIFSPRQINILTMVAKGLTSKEIGVQLEISARTVETHLERMRTRTGAKTSAQLVAIAFDPGHLAS